MNSAGRSMNQLLDYVYDLAKAWYGSLKSDLLWGLGGGSGSMA